jgi:hypothetical protein
MGICPEDTSTNILNDIKLYNIKKAMIGGSKRVIKKLASLYKNKMRDPEKAKQY